jgi:Ca-activated chloride channel family protein
MRRYLPALALLLAWAATAQAHGLLIPDEKTLPPLAMLNHKVTISIEDQVAVTKVEQTFRNHTDRNLEATYIFPVPKGASVNDFTMYVDGKAVKGELLEAAKAREVYTSFVRRTQDPGLLEYMDNKLLRMRVFPIAPKSDQKVSLSFNSVSDKESNLVEYIYPLKTDGKATSTLESFSITGTIKSQHAVQNVYSPTHAITLKRANDQEVSFSFDKNQGLLDKDFQVFYSTGDKDVGLTALTHRPISTESGYVALLMTPKVEIPKEYQIPRDVVLVLDTSGSMREDDKIGQARKALKYILANLNKNDRFAMINFATTVNKYRDELTAADSEQLAAAQKWVDRLEATGGTAIDAALKAALTFRSKDEGRAFTVVFFTDGEPTIGETKPDKILKNFATHNTANTRVFTFGVGNDVNATFLDNLAEQTRAVSTYVRPKEDIEHKVSGMYAKISNPVLTNLQLTATNDIQFSEMYPAELPDLFHGQQLVVFARYNGKGPSAIKLTGKVGKETKEFVYEMKFPEKSANDNHEFVEHLWARRKVGFMLDQIRANGPKQELVDEVVALAKKYGITTPYTSWLIVPDGAVPVVGGPRPPIHRGPGGATVPPGLAPGGGSGGKPVPVEDFAKRMQEKPGDVDRNRGVYADEDLKKGDGKDPMSEAKLDAKEKKEAYDKAREALGRKDNGATQTGKLGVDLSVQMQNLRNQTRLEQTALKQVYGRNCVEIGGVWIDEGFDPKNMKTLTVKAQSDAYFKVLDRHAKMKEVFQLGNHLVWVTPNNTALIIDTSTGKEDLTDEEVDALFKKK